MPRSAISKLLVEAWWTIVPIAISTVSLRTSLIWSRFVRFRVRSTRKFPPPPRRNREGEGVGGVDLWDCASCECRMIARYLEKGIRFTVRSSIPWSPRNRAAETRRTAPDWPGTIARISNQDGGDVTGNARAYGRWVGENVGRLSFYIVSPVTLAGSVDRRTWTLMVIWAADRAETYLLPGFVIVLGNRLLSCYDARARPAPPPLPPLPSALESRFCIRVGIFSAIPRGFDTTEKVQRGGFFSSEDTEWASSQMTQRVPNSGYYDNIVEDHSYTMFSMYPPTNTGIPDHWQLMKEDAMVKKRYYRSSECRIRF
jgi:hypothetical protein